MKKKNSHKNKKYKLKNCCDTELPDIKCLGNKKYKLPRKYTKKDCINKLKKLRKKKSKKYNKKKILNICSPYKNC